MIFSSSFSAGSGEPGGLEAGAGLCGIGLVDHLLFTGDECGVLALNAAEHGGERRVQLVGDLIGFTLEPVERGSTGPVELALDRLGRREQLLTGFPDPRWPKTFAWSGR
jgi:hypothetical protein